MKLKHLQIDTEGHDANIMKGLYDYLFNVPNVYHPQEIRFETNSNTTAEETDTIIELFVKLSYTIVSRR